MKDFGGKPGYDEVHQIASNDSRLRGSRQVRIRFADGEELGGLMNRFPPLGPFFFMLPLDQQAGD